MRRSSSYGAPFNVEKFVFSNVYQTDAPTLKGANRHEHGRQLNIVPGGSQLRGARFGIGPGGRPADLSDALFEERVAMDNHPGRQAWDSKSLSRASGTLVDSSKSLSRAAGAWVDSSSRGSGALVAPQ